MPRPLRTVPLVVALSLSAVGCSTLYRPIYSPGKTNYKKPPEKKESAELLLNTPTNGAPPSAPVPNAGEVPGLPPADGAAPPAAPGMLDAPPAIPGLPPP